MATGLFAAGAAALCGALSTAATAIGTACGTIGGVVMTTVGTLGAGLLKLGEMVKPILEVINTLAAIMSIKPAGEDPAELALKAEKSGRKPEEFDSVEDYIAYIRNEIHLDKEELNKLDDAQKIMYTTMGSCLYVKAMEERYQMVFPQSFWEKSSGMVKSGAMTPGQLKETMESMKEHGVKDAGSFSNYMEGKAGMVEQMTIFASLKDALHKEFPDLSDADLNTKVTHIKDFVQQAK